MHLDPCLAIKIFHKDVKMKTHSRKKFSSQVSADVLASLRQFAVSEGRQLQDVIEDALREYLKREQTKKSRQHVISAFASSLDEFDSLYKELAK
jgi:hypothetical protein